MKNQKLSKSILKEIVKECLVEILAEGLMSSDDRSSSTIKTNNLKENISLAGNNRQLSGKTKKNNRTKFLDDISFKGNEEQPINNKLDKIAASVTTDPVLSEMLMDTAHTTLQEQLAADSKRGYTSTTSGDTAQRAVAESNPEELFGGEAAGKWASLAFNS
jgi:hypothetical protein